MPSSVTHEELAHARRHVTFQDLGTAHVSMNLDAYCPEHPRDLTDPMLLSNDDYRHAIEAFASALGVTADD